MIKAGFGINMKSRTRKILIAPVIGIAMTIFLLVIIINVNQYLNSDNDDPLNTDLLFYIAYFLPYYLVILFFAIGFQYFFDKKIREVYRNKKIGGIKILSGVLLFSIVFGLIYGNYNWYKFYEIHILYYLIFEGFILSLVYWVGNLYASEVLYNRYNPTFHSQSQIIQ